MSTPTNEPLKALLARPMAEEASLPPSDRHAADVEMSRVLHTAPLRMALDASGAVLQDASAAPRTRTDIARM